MDVLPAGPGLDLGARRVRLAGALDASDKRRRPVPGHDPAAGGNADEATPAEAEVEAIGVILRKAIQVGKALV